MYIKTGIVAVFLSASSMAFDVFDDNQAIENSGNYFFSPFFSKIGQANGSFDRNNLGFGFDAGVLYDLKYGYRAHYERLSFNDYKNSLGLDFMYFAPDKKAYLYSGARVSKKETWKIAPALGVGYLHELDNQWSLRAEAGGLYDISEKKAYPNILIGVLYEFGAESSYVNLPSPEILPVSLDKPVEINISVRFEHDSSVIESIYHEDLKRVSEFLKEYENTQVTFEGHTSSVGMDEYNLKLSNERARAVSDVMMKKYGIKSSRINYIGYGEKRLLVVERNKNDEAKNRRVTAVMSYQN